MKTMKKLGHLLCTLALATVTLSLSGCGQKGPLVLPEEKPANNEQPQQN